MIRVRWRGEEYEIPWNHCSFKGCANAPVCHGVGHDGYYVPVATIEQIEPYDSVKETAFCGEHLRRWENHEYCAHQNGVCST